MSDTSWDFEAAKPTPPETAPVPSGPQTGETVRTVPQAPTAPVAGPTPTTVGATPAPATPAPARPPLGRTVFAAPSSPSRPVGDRTGILPPPLPTPPVKDRYIAPGAIAPGAIAPASSARAGTGMPTFTPPAMPPTQAESTARVAAAAAPAPSPSRKWGWRAFAAFVAGAVISGAAFTAGTMVADDTTEAVAPTTVPVVATDDTPTPRLEPAAPSAENPAAFVADDLGPSVVQVRTNFGTGSGVVYREGGYIMTNNHVIENATDIGVIDFQGRALNATLIGADPRADIAVIQVDGLDLPVADLALGQELSVGQTAIAIGSPFDLTRTVTAGIISALNRPLENQGSGFTSMIQTDAPINPGNSGGPLANRLGEVIGINTAIRTDGVSNSNVGVGFAVPIDTAHRVAERIVAGESLEPGFLGVGRGQSAIGEVGVVIEDITAGSGAEDAGLQSGDRVLTVNGAPVTDFIELAGLISNNFPGDQIELEIFRGEQPLTITATLGDRP